MCARVLFLFAFMLADMPAEIIDRIAVTIDNQVITESEILMEIRLTAFLNGDPLDFSADAKRKAADRLIEQKLIRKEIALAHYVEPLVADSEAMLKQIQAQRFHARIEEYQEALQKYGITEEDLKAHLLWQITLLHFVDLRFRPGIQVGEREIHEYFDKRLPELQKNAEPGKEITFNDLRNQLEATLTDQRIDKQMNDWLAATKKRIRIEFRPEALQ